MPPKRKNASKAKSQPAVAEILPVVDSTTIDFPTPVSNFTARRPNNADNKEVQGEEKDSTAKYINETVVLDNLPKCIINNVQSTLDSDSEAVQNEEVPERKLVEKKRVTKAKPKLKKQTNKRSSNEENIVTKEIAKAVVSKSRKRPIDKDGLASKPSTSPTSELPKRNRRAGSVDTLSSKVSKTQKDTVGSVEEVKNKKGVKKDQQNVPDKITKPKKTTKKVLNEEKEKSSTQQNIDEQNNLPGKPKSKRVAKKDKVEIHKEEEVVEDKNVKVDSLDKGTAPKIEQSEELTDDINGDDSDSVPKTLELKPKRANKGKQIIEPPDNSEILSVDEVSNDSDYVLTKTTQKRVPKKKQADVKHKGSEENESKILKARGGRKVKGEDFEKVPQISSSTNDIEKTGDFPIGVPSSPEPGKNENKAAAVVKRKAKAKTVKK